MTLPQFPEESPMLINPQCAGVTINILLTGCRDGSVHLTIPNFEFTPTTKKWLGTALLNVSHILLQGSN